MVWILISLSIGVFFGLLLRLRGQERVAKFIEKSLIPVLYLFLFVIGFSNGSNPKVMEKFGWLSLEAALIALAGILGSLLLAPLAKRLVSRNPSSAGSSGVAPAAFAGRNAIGKGNNLRRQPNSDALHSSLKMFACFLLGIALGSSDLSNLATPFVGVVFLTVLHILLWVVGVAMGADPSILRSVRTARPAIFVVPVLVVIGTLMGTALIALLLPSVSPSQAMGVGAGLGCYTLSSALMTEAFGPALGVLALLVNLVREVVSIGLAPLIVRLFGPFGLLAVGAASTGSVLLPSISLCAGKDFVFLAVINGMVLMLAVPLLSTVIFQIV